MKAPSSSLSEDDGAEENQDSKESQEDIVFDYSDFFSVLMYYGHMNKDEIMNHSRAFLHGIYQTYYERVKENLDIAYFSGGKDNADSKDEKVEVPYAGQCELSASDYPTEFTKLPPKNAVLDSTPEKTREFLSGFGDAMAVFKDVQIIEDE